MSSEAPQGEDVSVPEMPEWIAKMKEKMWKEAPEAARLFASGERTTMVQYGISSRKRKDDAEGNPQDPMERAAWIAYVRANLILHHVLEDLYEEFGLGWGVIPVYRPQTSTAMYLKFYPGPEEGATSGGSTTPYLDVGM